MVLAAVVERSCRYAILAWHSVLCGHIGKYSVYKRDTFSSCSWPENLVFLELQMLRKVDKSIKVFNNYGSLVQSVKHIWNHICIE